MRKPGVKNMRYLGLPGVLGLALSILFLIGRTRSRERPKPFRSWVEQGLYLGHILAFPPIGRTGTSHTAECPKML